MVAFRNRLRTNTAARWLYQRWMAGRDYEDHFARSLVGAVDSSTVVWDIGANVGLYTARFLERGAQQVVCFEPAPSAVRELETRFAGNPRVHVLACALSNRAGTAPMLADGASPTNRLGASPSSAPSSNAMQVEVPMRRGDAAVAEHALPAPNVVKIDVEGYEWEVLQGLGKLLNDRSLRAVFIEIHFSLLHARGLDQAPSAIVALLEGAGLAVRWLDLSHIEATRRS